jgi:Zn-dependent protease
MQNETVAMGVMWYVAFLLSLTCHEASHAVAAKLGGDPTAFHGGQATLNPVPHMQREPFGTILVPILSYILGGFMIGWGSAPYDPRWQRQYPRRASVMALAGPAANFVLALLAAVAIEIGLHLGAFAAPESASFTHVIATTNPQPLAAALAVFLSILFSLNLLLGVFNLLPVPPLDGVSAIGLLLPERAALRLIEISRPFAFVGLLVAWVAFDRLFQPVFLTALNLLYPGSGYH